MPFRPIFRGKTKNAANSAVLEDSEEKKIAQELITLEEEKVYREGTVAIRDLISPSAFKVESNFLQLGNIT